MFRQTKQRRVQKHFTDTVIIPSGTEYPFRLNFYTTPPLREVTLEDFELWAIDRLHVLGEIESSIFRNKSQKEIEQNLKPLFDKALPLSSNTARTLKGSDLLEEERRKDHYSHFILRLAFCRSDDLRRRFVRAESMLFKIRLNTDDTRERQAFIDSLNFDWVAVTEDEKRQLHDKLAAASSQHKVDAESYFKVDFERVLGLVEKRRVYLQDGKAYLPSTEQSSFLIAEFEKQLEKALETTLRALPRLDEDDRLIPILNHLSLGFTASEYTSQPTTVGEIGAGQIDNLTKHFPLCMRNLHNNLRRDKHLRHFGRLQYGLFLKGVGLNPDEALIFWRKAFSTITDDKFNKEYRYNVRHSYGLEGNRRNYKPYSCQQIILGPQPGSGDSHGCPFRHFSLENLTAAVQSLGINESRQLRDIQEAVQGRHYHVACTKVWEFTHANVKAGLAESISHPNMYFEKSYGIEHPQVKIEGEDDTVDITSTA